MYSLKHGLDDVELETALQIRSHDLSWSSIHTETPEEPSSLPISADTGADHGFTRDKRSACCGMSSSGLVDCQACLDSEVDRFPEYLDEAERACALEIISLLNDAGPHGIGKKELVVSFGYLRFTKALTPSYLIGSNPSTGAYGRVWRSGQSDLTSHAPLLLDWVLIHYVGDVDLPADMGSRYTGDAGHGEAAEMDRYQWCPGARDMGGGIEGCHGDDRLQASNYPGTLIEGRKSIRRANLGAG